MPATCSLAPNPALAVISKRPPPRSVDAPESVSVIVLPVVSCVRTVVHQTEIHDPSVAVEGDWEISSAFCQTFPDVSATD